jgi:hypothetical protein
MHKKIRVIVAKQSPEMAGGGEQNLVAKSGSLSSSLVSEKSMISDEIVCAGSAASFGSIS